MSDLVGYSHDFLAEFIHLYRSFRCLWQVRYRGYKDKILRNRAYDALVQKLREVNPIADKETVIRKINTLRTAFRREYKKVRNSQKMVQNPRLRYRSSLWYYDILKFVAEQNETSPLDEERDFKNALANPTDLSQEEMMSVQTDVDKIEPPSPVPSPAASSAPAFQPIILETEGSYARRISTSASADPLRRKCHQQPESFQDRQPKDSTCEISPRQFASSVTDDHFETFGRYVAGKLRKSMPRQSIIAEKVIAEVLLRANLGTLEEATCLTEKGRTADHRLPVEQNTTSTNLLARMADRSPCRRVNSGSQPMKQDLLFSYT